MGLVFVSRFVLDDPKPKVLVLASQTKANSSAAVERACATCDVVEIPTIEKAMEALRAAITSAPSYADTSDFLPLERALVSQQASLVLNTIGEGVCIVDAEGRTNWSNKKMQAWPARVHETIRRTCQGSFELFSKQVSPQHPDTPALPAFNRSKRYMLNIDDQQFHGDDRVAGDQPGGSCGAGGGGGVGCDGNPAVAAEDRRHRPCRPRIGEA